MLIIKKIENGHYEMVQRFADGSEKPLSWIMPSSVNKRQYDAICFGWLERFRTIAEWKKWCVKTYGEYTMQ